MKTLAYYMSLPYPMEIIPDEGGFVATVPDLPGCMSSGVTVEEALEGLGEAKELWLEGKLEDGEPIAEPSRVEDYSGKFVLRIPKSLHRTLDHRAQEQGISLNQYLVHLLSERSAVEWTQHEFRDAFSSWVQNTFIDLRGQRSPHAMWEWPISAERAFVCGSRPTHHFWGFLEHKSQTEVIFDVDGSAVIPMLEHLPSVPDKIVKPHKPNQDVDYQKSAGRS